MTTSNLTHSTSSERASGWPALAAIGVGLAAVLTAIGSFWDVTGNDDGSNDDALMEYLFTLGIIVVAAAVVFGLVARTATPSNGARRALVLALVAIPSVAVFWAGLPTVLAAGAAACALVASPRNAAAKAALGIAALVTVLSVVLAIVG